MKVWIALIATLAVLGGCGSSGLSDEASYLAASGFSQPVQGHVFLATYQDGASVADDENTAIIGALLRSGYVHIVPDTEQAPWWRYNVREGAINLHNLSFPLGERRILNRRNERSWSEGSREYFSETIDYEIRYRSNFDVSDDHRAGPFTIRLVLVNDPAIGQWQVSPQSELSSLVADGRTAQAALSQSDGARLVAQRIAAAQAQAHETMSASIMSTVGLVRTDDREVISQPSQDRLFHLVQHALPDGTTFSQARQVCLSLRKRNRSWRLANVTDIQSLLVQRGNNWVIDTPAYSIWGDALRSNPLIVTGTWYRTGSSEQPSDQVPLSTRSNLFGYTTLHVREAGRIWFDSGYSDDYRLSLGDVRVAWNVGDGSSHRTVMCVSQDS